MLKAEEVTSVRHLFIPLVQSERAWSYAMQMKDEARLAEDIPPRVKFHIIRRFKKAVKWARTLTSLSKNIVDAKTALEIEAYECWLNGILLLEQEHWKDSFNSSAKARTIYEQMVKMGDTDEQDLFNERVMEIDISLRYCNFQLGESEDIKSIIAANHHASGLDLLQAKLEVYLSIFISTLLPSLPPSLPVFLISPNYHRHYHHHHYSHHHHHHHLIIAVYYLQAYIILIF